MKLKHAIIVAGGLVIILGILLNHAFYPPSQVPFERSVMFYTIPGNDADPFREINIRVEVVGKKASIEVKNE